VPVQVILREVVAWDGANDDINHLLPLPGELSFVLDKIQSRFWLFSSDFRHY
jgi:hypothetical protein